MKNYEIKKVLSPIDFSPVSLNALNTAITMCVKHDASLYIIHVIENTRFLYTAAGGLSAIALLPELLRTANEKLNEIATKIRNDHKITVRYGVSTGNPCEAICQEAYRDQSDLVVVGSHGVNNFKELIVGSTTYQVVRSCPCPVLSIPEESPWIDFRKILFPIRANSFSYEKYDFVRPIVKKEGASVLLAAITDSNDDCRLQVELTTEVMSKTLAAEDVVCGINFYKCKNEANQVLEIADAEKPDLIVITTTVENSIWDFLIKVYPREIVNLSRYPVLSIRPQIEVKAQIKAVEFIDERLSSGSFAFG